MNFAEFHFIRPYWFLAIIPTLIIGMLFIRHKLSTGNWSAVCDAELLPFILQDSPEKSTHWLLSSTLFACLLSIIALAGPTWERLPSPVFRNDAALVIALSLSQTMNANDIKPSRLTSARFKLIDILKQRKDGQTALLVYSGDAFVVSPLTEDVDTIINQISALETHIMPSAGQRTDLAIQQAINLLKQAGLQQGEILLMTDAVNMEKTRPLLTDLNAYHLSVLGIGTANGSPIKSPQGGFLKDASGSIIVPKLKSQELIQVAKLGGGIYQIISSDDKDINALNHQFDNPNKIENQDNNLLIEQWHEKGIWLLFLILPLMALPFRKGILSITLLCLLPLPKQAAAMEWDELWTTNNQQAQQAFQQKNYQQAAEQFDNPQWQAAAYYKAEQYQQAAELLAQDETALGRYNLGNALAKSGELQKAMTAYEQALTLEPDNEDAKYNKQQVEKQLEKQQQDKEQKGDDNKDSDSDENKDNKEQQGDDKESEKNQSESKKSEQQENKENQEKETSTSEENKAEEEQENEQNQATPEEPQYDESKQANEQWLNTIPDNPAGLLKRKFKYQYNQRR